MKEPYIIDTAHHVILAAEISMAILFVAGLVSLVRMLRGPSLSDRVVALDFLTSIMVSFIGAFAVFQNDARYLDVAIILAVVAFLATVSYARYMERITATVHQQKDKL